ncbi:hypothetical protein ABTX60_07320 [Streptomyces sp. NPDC126510]|uniref:hypothetical protein n=1 Tax=Streptomyces sp. NPDC126510 TaxID=3155317 RepID=UPI00331B2899
MVQNLVAVFSLLIGTAGLLLSYAGHRQKVRQDAQERALRADEQQRMEHERQRHEQEWREMEARAQEEREAHDRERDRYQASMIGGHIGLSPSSLDDSWVVPQVVIYNGSNQPVRDVRASLRGEVKSELPLVETGHHHVPLPPIPVGERYDQLGEVTVEFTDAAGVRWRREGYGALRRAQQGAGGQEIWGHRESPVVERVVEHPDAASPAKLLPRVAAPDSPATAKRRANWLGPVVVVVSVVLIAGGVWWLLQ